MRFEYQKVELRDRAEKRHKAIRAYVAKHPDESYSEVGNHFGVTRQTVMKALKEGAK